jgi:arylsulfatase A-like enzyme
VRYGVVSLAAVLVMALSVSAEAQGVSPNILLIMTDDQRPTETMLPGVMPFTASLRDAGTSFPNAYATTPLCCPSRASTMSGQYAHNTGVRRNRDALNLDQGTTIQRYLQDAGYVTGTVGKFLNQWPLAQEPSYFDRFTITHGGYFDYRANEGGSVSTVGKYHTKYISDQAVSFLGSWNAHNDEIPWYLAVQTYAPHGPPIPESRYEDAPVGRWDGNPAVFEKNLEDKPPYVRNNPNPVGYSEGKKLRRLQLRTLMSVDDMVERLVQFLTDAGEVSTIIIFLSDNGLLWGEHKLKGKGHAYVQSVEIPMFIHGPGVLPGQTDSRQVANIDIAPTILELAGAPPVNAHDGWSLLGPHLREHQFLEYFGGPEGTPSWKSVRTLDEVMSRYADGFREHYRPTDPWELKNVGVGPRSPHEEEMLGWIGQDKDCAGTTGNNACP